MSTSLLDQLTAVAHQCWCRRMRDAGWKPGRKFDPDLRTHDAIRSFEKLSPIDQRHARTATEASGAIALLGRSIDYPRGHRQTTQLQDLVIGQHVKLVRADSVEGLNIQLQDVGWVLHLSRDEDEKIVQAIVAWPSGERTTHVLGDDDLLAVNGS